MVADRKILTGKSLFASDLADALGCPKHTSRIELTVDAQEIITVRCTFAPELSDDAVALVKDYVMIERAIAQEKGLI